MLRWMKVIVLLAGGLGVLGFLLPFHAVPLDGRSVKGSAYQMFLGQGDERLQYERTWGCTPMFDYDGHATCEEGGGPVSRTLVPWYFLSTLVFLVAGITAIWRKRMSFMAGICSLAATLYAIGCWLHELNASFRDHLSEPMIGATLLGISGLVALVPTLAVLYWREPDPIPLFKIRLPVARLVKR